MDLYSTRRRVFSGEWWTPRRIRAAGLLAVVGALLLFARIAVGTYLEAQTTVFPWDEIGSLAYVVSEGGLTIAWACIFAGFAALRVRLFGRGGRLWNAGILLAMAGTAVATLGFFIVTVVPMLGTESVVIPGNAVIGIGIGLLLGIGTVLMGIALLRMEAVSRVIAVLLILDFPLGTGGVALMELLVGQQYWISVITILPLCAAVALIGYYLRTETPDVVSPGVGSD